MALLALPNELLAHIAWSLDGLEDLNSLIQTNSRTYNLLNGILYRRNIIEDRSRVLFYAVRHGQVATLEKFLTQASNRHRLEPDAINWLLKNAGSSLCETAGKGHEQMVELLLQLEGIDHSFRDHYRRTPLLTATSGGHETVAMRLLLDPMIHLSPRDDMCTTPLHFAAINGNDKVVEFLLSKRSSGNHQVVQCDNERHGATLPEGSTHLHESTVDPNCQDWRGQTPLCFAASNGRRRVVELLLAQEDIDVSRKNPHGHNALALAALWGHRAIIELLIARHDAELNARDNYGYTALALAAKEGHASVVDLLLSQPGIDPDPKEPYGSTALGLAAAKGHAEVVRLFLRHPQVDPEICDSFFKTSLAQAATNGHTAVVKLLAADRRVNMNAKDRTGATPLSWAAQSGERSTVEALLQHGAKIEIDDLCGQKALAMMVGGEYAVLGSHVLS